MNLSKLNKLSEASLENFSGKPYSTITNDVQITVWPEFIDSKSNAAGDLFIWAYHIRVDNRRAESIQLTSRYWRIIDEKGAVQEVNGEGVVGEQPIIAPNGSYQYSSGVHLRYPSGIMTGKYHMKKIVSGEMFEVEIPTFSLDVPNLNNAIH